MKRAVFLDRDGVVNLPIIRGGKPYPPASVEDLVIPDEVKEGLGLLKKLGLPLLVVTNQPDVARGTQTREAVEAINFGLLRALPLDAIYVCYHDDTDNCDCRKPKPGLIWQGARDWGVDPAKSFLVGDRWRDIAAGQQAACTAIFLDFQYAETQPVPPYYRVSNLLEAARLIEKLILTEE